MKLFAVFGSPVSHSLSPVIWNHSFRELGIDAHYIRINVPSASDAALMIRELGLAGCNITSPFKEDMLALIDKTEGDASSIGAVNCIVQIGKKLVGYNTDVDGFYSALVLNGFNPQGKKAVILGSGGAAKAVVHSLLKNGAGEVVIANRNYDKAERLARDFKCRTCYIDKIDAETKDAQLLVSCVSSLDRVIKKEAVHRRLTVFDANYSGASVLIKDAEFAGCRIIDGREWLVYQAAFFFKDLFNELPVEHMKSALSGVRKDPGRRGIALIGFMGTGKTSIGRTIAERLGYGFVDLDTAIEKKKGKAVERIFDDEGEAEFRRLESEELRAVDKGPRIVISCGGGIVTREENISYLKENFNVIWLWSPISEIRQRISGEGRPLFKGIDSLLTQRLPMYARACDLCVLNSDKKNTVKQILREVEVEKH